MSASIMALDVGSKRVGIAVTSLAARLPRPLVTLQYADNVLNALAELLQAEQVSVLVVGYPRGLQGQHTQQTEAIESFTAQLKARFSIPIHYQDEALTSKKATAELETRGKDYTKGDIDALAATYILEDFLSDHPQDTQVTSHGVLQG